MQAKNEVSAPDSSVSNNVGYVYRDALRLLFILVRGGEPLEQPFDHWDQVFLGEKRALAIDFWLRYPDYLADQLLNIHSQTQDASLLEAAEQIFDEDQPDVRIVRMIRWRRGAFDDLQTSLSVLGFRGLARPMRRKLPTGNFQFEYLTGPLARGFLDEAVAEQPELAWYERQTQLALLVAQDKSGSALKDMHYADEEYAATPYGATIPSIKSRVLERIARIRQRNPA
ncbi:TPA: hypothetical protein L4G11_001229 [Pseudomonas aeruginosa]|nr:hypothetical protein [Pseudomonas aeruginosa]